MADDFCPPLGSICMEPILGHTLPADMTPAPYHFQAYLADPAQGMMWHNSDVGFASLNKSLQFQASENLLSDKNALNGNLSHSDKEPDKLKYHDVLSGKPARVNTKAQQKLTPGQYFKGFDKDSCAVHLPSAAAGKIALQEDTTMHQYFTPELLSFLGTQNTANDQMENTGNDQIPSPRCVLSTSAFRSYTSGYSTPNDQQHPPPVTSSTSTSTSMQPGDAACISLNELLSFMLEESNNGKQHHRSLAAKDAMPANVEHEGTMPWLNSFQETMMDMDGSLDQDINIYDLVQEKGHNGSISNHTNDNVLLIDSIDAFTDGLLGKVDEIHQDASIYAQQNNKVDLYGPQDYNCGPDGLQQEDPYLASSHLHLLAGHDMQELTQMNAFPSTPPNTPARTDNNQGFHMMKGGPASSGDEDHHGIRLVHLLIACAEAIETHDIDLAAVILVQLRELVSPMGSTMQRVAACFSEGLQRRIEETQSLQSLPLLYNTQSFQFPPLLYNRPSSLSFTGSSNIGAPNITDEGMQQQAMSSTARSNHGDNVLAAFHLLHEILPYIKFVHFTANQAILEAVQDEKRIHIVDYEIMEGIQWPCLMQALAHRKGGPPQHLRITALWHNTSPLTGTSAKRASCHCTSAKMSSVQGTGKRLTDLASSLKLPFTFTLLRVDSEDQEVPMSALKIVKDEALVANCMLQLPHMPYRPATSVTSFLKSMRKLYPVVLTLGEDEMGCSNAPSISSFFVEALHHYSSVFDSLEACIRSEGAVARMLVERVFLAPKIASTVAFCGRPLSMSSSASSASSPTPAYGRPNQFGRNGATSSASSKCNWHTLVSSSGFASIPLSFHSCLQARLLLGVFRDGFKLQEDGNRLLLGWRSRPLVAASAWR